MTEAFYPYSLGVRTRAWIVLTFLIGLAYAGWFGFVVWGEQEGYGDDPGAWAYLSTPMWGYIGLGLYLLIALYYVLLLSRKEVPPKTYTVGTGGEGEQEAPGFLQGAEPGQAPSIELKDSP